MAGSIILTTNDFSLGRKWEYVFDYTDELYTNWYKPSITSSNTSTTKTFTISGIPEGMFITGMELKWTGDYSGSWTYVSSGAPKVNSTSVASGSQSISIAGTGGNGSTITISFSFSPSPATSVEGAYGVTSSLYYYWRDVELYVYYDSQIDDPGNGLWVGVSDVAHKVKNMYIGVDGVARKVKAAWVGDANGKARLFYRSEVLTTITGSVCYYRTSSYPLSINRTSGQVGPTSTANQGAIVMFDFTGYDASRISTSQNVTVVLHFAGTSYLSSVRKILPDQGLVPYYNSSTTNSTSFTSFKGKTNSAHGGTVSGRDITLTFTGSQLKTWVTSNLVTPTSSGKKFLTFGVRINYNNTNLYDTTNPPTISFYYS